MIRSIGRGLDALVDHYVAGCMFLALLVLTLLGVGDLRLVSAAGLLLCVAGLAQRSARADMWVLLPLILYNLIGMASALAAYGSIMDGYGPLHLVFPIFYLLTACMEPGEMRLLRRLCLLWAGVVAVHGTVWFVCDAAVRGGARRLGGMLGNPNALGIFLVLAWFFLMDCLPGEGEKAGRWTALLPHIEPLLLFALALTLSMGSFLAMAAGILTVWLEGRRDSSWRERTQAAFRLLAKAALGIGLGILIYLGAARTDAPWICLPLALYGAAVTLGWKKLERFLAAFPKVTALIAAAGLLVAAAAVAVRPSSIATFAERLEMMANGLRYLFKSPLLGVGPFRWRILNLYDGDKYFNTWHIHNVLIHVGVEFGWIAMGALAVIAARFLKKRHTPPEKAGFVAFCVHNMLDTSFFYVGITSLTVVMAGNPGCGGKKIGCAGIRLIFGLFAAVYAYAFFRSMLAV